mgnify:CR=1 FL=1
MKRIIGLLLCLCTIFSLCLALTSCLRRSAEDREKMVRYDENGIGYIKVGRRDENGKFLDYNDFCVVRMPVDISEDHCEIEIPERYTSMSLDPNFPCEWKIVGEGFISYESTESSENTPIFTIYIHISKQMTNIRLPNDKILYKKLENGEYEKYIIKLYFYCDEENKVYYSEDGVLYYKSNKIPLAYQ